MPVALIVDDEPYIAEGISNLLDWKQHGFSTVLTARQFEHARKILNVNDICLCVCDVCLDGGHKGFELIDLCKESGAATCFIMVSGHSEFSYAIDAIRRGAIDYILKPVDVESLGRAVEQAALWRLGKEPEQKKGVLAESILGLPMNSLSPLVAKMVRYVTAEYANTSTIADLAEKFRKNPTYLGQLFIQETGRKFTDFVMEYRLHKAKELLETGDAKISDIAQWVGYTKLNYFYTRFRAYFNCSPSEMRRKEQ